MNIRYSASVWAWARYFWHANVPGPIICAYLDMPRQTLYTNAHARGWHRRSLYGERPIERRAHPRRRAARPQPMRRCPGCCGVYGFTEAHTCPPLERRVA